MSDEKKNLPDGAAGEDHEKDIESSAVGVGSETDAEGSSRTPGEKLERIAAEHDVPVDRDPEEAQAEAEGSSADKDRDVRGGDTKEEEGSDSEPPD